MKEGNVQCLKCLRWFRDDHDYDKHLFAQERSNFYRCGTDAQLRAVDLIRNRRGLWVTPLTAGKQK